MKLKEIIFQLCRFRRYSTKFLNFWPLNRWMVCIRQTQLTLPLETCNTAITFVQNHNNQETATILLCNGDDERFLSNYHDGGTHRGHNGTHHRLNSDNSQEERTYASVHA